MAKSYELLRQAIDGIRNEVEDGANTAARVGGAMLDTLDFAYERAEALDEGLKSRSVDLGTFSSFYLLNQKLDAMNGSDFSVSGRYIGEVATVVNGIKANHFPFTLVISRWGGNYLFQALQINATVESMNNIGDNTIIPAESSGDNLLVRRWSSSKWEPWRRVESDIIEKINVIESSTVWLSESQYKALVENGEVKANVEYNIYEDE